MPPGTEIFAKPNLKSESSTTPFRVTAASREAASGDDGSLCNSDSAAEATRCPLSKPFIEKLRDHFSLPIFYITHDMTEVERLAEHIVLLKDFPFGLPIERGQWLVH
jgi:hypothetical protein